MATISWNKTAAGTYTWGDGANWTGGSAPVAGDLASVVVAASGAQTLNVATSASVGSITLQDTSATFTGFTVSATAGRTLTLDNLGGSVTITVAGTSSTISSPLGGTVGFTKAGNQTLFMTGSGSTLSGTITVATAHPTVNVASLLFSSDYSGTEFGYPTVNNPAVTVTGANTIVSFMTRPAADVTVGGNISVNTTDALGTSYGYGVYTGAYSTGGARTQTFTGNISLTSGNFVIAGFAEGLAATYYMRTKTSTMSGTGGKLHLFASATSGNRFATYLYGGAGNYTIDTPVQLNNGSSATAASYGWSICNASSGGGTVTFSGNVTKQSSASTGVAGTVTFGSTTVADDTGDIVVSGIIDDVDSGALSIIKTSNSTTPRKLTLSGANTYAGTTTISAGTLSAQNNAALGVSSVGAVTVSLGGSLEITDGITVDKTSVAVSLSGTGVSSSGVVSVPASVLPAVTAAGLTAASFTLGAGANEFKVGADSRLTLASAGAISGASAGVKTTGTGTLVLAQSNANSTFAGLYITNGTVEVPYALANAGLASTIGSGSAASAWEIGSSATAGTFKYTGAVGTSTNRPYTIGVAGCTIDSSCTTGVLAMTSTAAPTFTPGASCTLTLAGTAGTYGTPNTLGTPLADNSGSAVGLTKSGTGAWSMTSVVSYTGTTTVSGGYLTFSNNNLATSVTFSGNGATLGKVKLTGSSKTITCSAGAGNTAELISDDTGAAGNTITGSTNVTSGTLRLTTEQTVSSKPVKVTGDTNVTVSANASIRTTTGTNQKGQMRYGGNLSFSANSALYIGG